MPDSYLLPSQEHVRPMQQQAAQAEHDAIANTPRAAFEMFMRMREAQERSQQNATVTALEQAKLVEYSQRNAAFNMELDTRMKFAQVKLAEAEASRQREQQMADRESFGVPPNMIGDVYEENGRGYKWMPGGGGERQLKRVDASDEEFEHFKKRRSAELSKVEAQGEEDRARAKYYREGGFQNRHNAESDSLKQQKDKLDIEKTQLDIQDKKQQMGLLKDEPKKNGTASTSAEDPIAVLQSMRRVNADLGAFEKEVGDPQRAHGAIVLAAQSLSQTVPGLSMQAAVYQVLDYMKSNAAYRQAIAGKAKAK